MNRGKSPSLGIVIIQPGFELSFMMTASGQSNYARNKTEKTNKGESRQPHAGKNPIRDAVIRG